MESRFYSCLLVLLTGINFGNLSVCASAQDLLEPRHHKSPIGHIKITNNSDETLYFPHTFLAPSRRALRLTWSPRKVKPNESLWLSVYKKDDGDASFYDLDFKVGDAKPETPEIHIGLTGLACNAQYELQQTADRSDWIFKQKH